MKETKLHHTLKELRKNKKISQKDLAEVIGIDQSAISKYERGVQLPELQIAMKISDFFGVTLDELIYSKDFTVGESYLIEDVEKGFSSEYLNSKYNFIEGISDEEFKKIVELVKVLKKESN